MADGRARRPSGCAGRAAGARGPPSPCRRPAGGGSWGVPRHVQRPTSSGAYQDRPPGIEHPSATIATPGSGSLGSTGTCSPSSGPPCRRRVLRDGPHRPPPAHRRAAVHREVHGANPRRRRRASARPAARTDVRRAACRRSEGQQGRAPPRGGGREDRRIRTAYLEGRSIAALAREHRVSRGAIRTAVADLLPDHAAREEETPPRSCRSPSTCRARSPTTSAPPTWSPPSTLRQEFGADYAQGGKECDEYPFAVTYEGCALPSYDSTAPKNNSSARALPKADNGNAGNLLGQFLTLNRIIDGKDDGFYVTII